MVPHLTHMYTHKKTSWLYTYLDTFSYFLFDK
jgi:hypothetical protein